MAAHMMQDAESVEGSAREGGGPAMDLDEGRSMVRNLQGAREGVDKALERSEMQLFQGGAVINATDFGRDGGNETDADDSEDDEDDDNDDDDYDDEKDAEGEGGGPVVGRKVPVGE
eukprot:scaffold17863_cov31-Prasinocladus_malaysianus.AAC.1